MVTKFWSLWWKFQRSHESNSNRNSYRKARSKSHFVENKVLFWPILTCRPDMSTVKVCDQLQERNIRTKITFRCNSNIWTQTICLEKFYKYICTWHNCPAEHVSWVVGVGVEKSSLKVPGMNFHTIDLTRPPATRVYKSPPKRSTM